jgi:hypothetical protein
MNALEMPQSSSAMAEWSRLYPVLVPKELAKRWSHLLGIVEDEGAKARRSRCGRDLGQRPRVRSTIRFIEESRSVTPPP